MPNLLYDRIGAGYSLVRHEDDRIRSRILSALGDARSVLNVGAGTGSYEPADRETVAVEPSAVMIAQRGPATAPVIRASAEQLPFADDSFDAVMAVISDHHWADRHRGLHEMARVARRRVVVVNADPAAADLFWLTTEYLPEFMDLIPHPYRDPGVWQASFETAFEAPVQLVAVPVPHDCTDGFYSAYWRRPTAYLDPAVRAGISVFCSIDEDAVTRAVSLLRSDLRHGVWEHPIGICCGSTASTSGSASSSVSLRDAFLDELRMSQRPASRTRPRDVHEWS